MSIIRSNPQIETGQILPTTVKPSSELQAAPTASTHAAQEHVAEPDHIKHTLSAERGFELDVAAAKTLGAMQSRFGRYVPARHIQAAFDSASAEHIKANTIHPHELSELKSRVANLASQDEEAARGLRNEMIEQARKKAADGFALLSMASGRMLHLAPKQTEAAPLKRTDAIAQGASSIGGSVSDLNRAYKLGSVVERNARIADTLGNSHA